MTPETIYGILGGISALLVAVIGACAKLHLQSSSCGRNGCCCNIVFDEDERKELTRHRTDKRRRRETEENIKINYEKKRHRRKNRNKNLESSQSSALPQAPL